MSPALGRVGGIVRTGYSAPSDPLSVRSRHPTLRVRPFPFRAFSPVLTSAKCADGGAQDRFQPVHDAPAHLRVGGIDARRWVRSPGSTREGGTCGSRTEHHLCPSLVQHIAASRITDFRQDSLAGRAVPPKATGEGFTLVVAGIAVIHEFLTDLAAAVDDLVESRGEFGPASHRIVAPSNYIATTDPPGLLSSVSRTQLPAHRTRLGSIDRTRPICQPCPIPTLDRFDRPIDHGRGGFRR
jgi:hypothetical protein